MPRLLLDTFSPEFFPMNASGYKLRQTFIDYSLSQMLQSAIVYYQKLPLPEMYLLRDFEKTKIKEETLTLIFKGNHAAAISLQIYSATALQEVKDCIVKAAKYCG